MRALILKYDPTGTGKLKRFIFGKPGGEISGAVYLDPKEPIPNALLLGFPEEMVNKFFDETEVKDNDENKI